MTIGDEKVVQRWTPEICEDEQDGQIVAGMDPYTEGHYVLHSDYASLLEEKNQVAAERDSLERALSHRNESLLHSNQEYISISAQRDAAESQLAELRGRVVKLTAAESDALSGLVSDLEHQAGDVYDCAPRIDDDEDAYWAYQQYQAIRKLRTLAAADGTTTGETK